MHVDREPELASSRPIDEMRWPVVRRAFREKGRSRRGAQRSEGFTTCGIQCASLVGEKAVVAGVGFFRRLSDGQESLVKLRGAEPGELSSLRLFVS